MTAQTMAKLKLIKQALIEVLDKESFDDGGVRDIKIKALVEIASKSHEICEDELEAMAIFKAAKIASQTYSSASMKITTLLTNGVKLMLESSEDMEGMDELFSEKIVTPDE